MSPNLWSGNTVLKCVKQHWFLTKVLQKLYVNSTRKVNYVNIYNQKERICSTFFNIAKKPKNTATCYLLHAPLGAKKRNDAERNFCKTFFIKKFCENVTDASV